MHCIREQKNFALAPTRCGVKYLRTRDRVRKPWF